MEKSDIAGAEWEGLIRRNLQSFGYIKQGVQGNGLFNVGSFRVAESVQPSTSRSRADHTAYGSMRYPKPFKGSSLRVLLL